MKVFVSEQINVFDKSRKEYLINVSIFPPKNFDNYEHLNRIYESTFNLFCGSKSWKYDIDTHEITMSFDMKNDIGQLIKILSWYDRDTVKVSIYGL